MVWYYFNSCTVLLVLGNDLRSTSPMQGILKASICKATTCIYCTIDRGL